MPSTVAKASARVSAQLAKYWPSRPRGRRGHLFDAFELGKDMAAPSAVFQGWRHLPGRTGAMEARWSDGALVGRHGRVPPARRPRLAGLNDGDGTGADPRCGGSGRRPVLARSGNRGVRPGAPRRRNGTRGRERTAAGGRERPAAANSPAPRGRRSGLPGGAGISLRRTRPTARVPTPCTPFTGRAQAAEIRRSIYSSRNTASMSLVSWSRSANHCR